MASFNANANANANDQNEEVKNLVGSMKTACDMLQPLIFIFYSAISSGGTSGTSKLKADKSFFTIADGLGTSISYFVSKYSNLILSSVSIATFFQYSICWLTFYLVRKSSLRSLAKRIALRFNSSHPLKSIKSMI